MKADGSKESTVVVAQFELQLLGHLHYIQLTQPSHVECVLKIFTPIFCDAATLSPFSLSSTL